MKNNHISEEMYACLKRYWGYEQFRPWQEDTILAILEERETLTILPAGGGDFGVWNFFSEQSANRYVMLDKLRIMYNFCAQPLVAARKKEISIRQKAKKAQDWAGVDEKLFELLRGKRAELAQKQGVPTYIIFGDRSLKDMASVKPTTCEAFSGVFGVGEHKLKIYAEPFIDVIKEYSRKSLRD